MLFIAHDLALVRYFCDRIAVMNAGKILELAPSKELFKTPLHDYTKALLSAIPYPDPDYEKGRKRAFYEPKEYLDDEAEELTLREIKKNRYVYATEGESKAYKEQLKNKHAKK